MHSKLFAPWWAILEYYKISGDENIHDATTNSFNDYHLNLNTNQGGASGDLQTARATTPRALERQFSGGKGRCP
jgi:hypothetical protein